MVDNYFKAMNIWPNKRWIGSSGAKVENIELWKRLRKEVKKCPINVDIEWVKAHKGHKYNKAADRLAKQSAEMPFNEPFSQGETTKKWSDRSTKRGSVAVYGQEIKIRIISREYKKNNKIFEYRYEVIDPKDRDFKDLDFVFYEEYLSRNKCLKVRFGLDQTRPSILEVIEELECTDYKH